MIPWTSRKWPKMAPRSAPYLPVSAIFSRGTENDRFLAESGYLDSREAEIPPYFGRKMKTRQNFVLLIFQGVMETHGRKLVIVEKKYDSRLYIYDILGTWNKIIQGAER